MLIASASAARLDHLLPGYSYSGGNYNSGNNAAPFNFENINNGDGSYRFR